MTRVSPPVPPPDIEFGLRYPDGHERWSWTTAQGARTAAAERDPHPVVIARRWTCVVTELIPEPRTTEDAS